MMLFCLLKITDLIIFRELGGHRFVALERSQCCGKLGRFVVLWTLVVGHLDLEKLPHKVIFSVASICSRTRGSAQIWSRRHSQLLQLPLAYRIILIAKLHHFELLLGATLASDLSRGVEEGLFVNKGPFSRVSFGCYLFGRLEHVILLEKLWIEW